MTLALASCLLALGQATPARAQEGRAPTASVPTPSAPTHPAAGAPRRGPPVDTEFELAARGEATSGARIADRDGGARLGVVRTRVDAGVSGNPWDPVRLSLDLTAERSDYDWLRPTGVGAPEVSAGEDPWDALQSAGASLGARVSLGPRWGVALRGSVGVGVEPGADPQDGLSGSLAVVVTRRFDATLVLGLGLMGLSRLEDSPMVVPALFVRWQPLEGLVVETAGPGLRVVARVADPLDLSLRAGLELRQWRLGERRPRLSSAVVQETRVALALGLAWRIAPPLRLSLEIGVYPYMEVRLRDRRGHDVRRLQGDVAGLVGVGLELSF